MRTRAQGLPLVFVLIFVPAISPLSAQAGRAVTSHDGSCQVMVPADWKSDLPFGVADSPDKSMGVAVTSPKMSPTLASVKQNVPQLYPNDKVVKDTPTEFQMEGQGMNGKPNVYRGIQIPGKVCLVEVNYSGDDIDSARKIAMTLKSAK
jgi:hypothetical protein